MAAATARTAAAHRRPGHTVAHAAALLLVVLGVAVNVWRPTAPALGVVPDPGRWFDAAHLETVAAYRRPLHLLALTDLVLALAVPLVVAFSPAGRRVVGRLVGLVGQQRPPRAAAAVVLGVLVVRDLVRLPVGFWAGYVHEGRFGFRTQGVGGWLYDWAAVRVPLWLGAAAVAAAAVVLIRRLPAAWPPVAGLAGAAVAGVVMFISPLVLEPLLVRTEPLPPGPVRSEVERVLRRADQPVERLIVADASRRTTKQNAYVSGLAGSRRVVLYDNLVARRPAPHVAVVVAHELGHRRNGDLARRILLGGAGTVVTAYVVAFVLRRRVAGGRQGTITDPRAAAVVLALVVLLGAVSMPIQAALRRRAEAAADVAALELSDNRAAYLALKEDLARANLSDVDPPWWVHALWQTHPTPPARLWIGERWPELDPEQAG